MKTEQEKSLTESVFALTKIIKQLRSEKYFQLLDNPKRFFLYKFLAGIMNGVGFAIGVSFFFAFIVWALSKLTVIPFLGDLIITILDYVEKMRMRVY